MSTTGVVLVSLLVAVVLVLVVSANDPVTQERVQARMAIDRCYGTVKDELLERDVRLLARGACQKMEVDFERKFNTRP